MSKTTRRILYAIAAIVPPALALVAGTRALASRDRPAPAAPLTEATLAAIPRPALDAGKPTVVVLLGADLTEITDALGPYEMFARAGGFNVVTASVTRQPSLLTGGLVIVPHYALAELDTLIGRPAIVVIPNLPNAADPMNRPIIEWIRGQYHEGSLIHSWCKGAMALAETGLLDGKTATAHWGDIPTLEKRYPRATWVRGVRWLEHDGIVMSAGITSGVDASLRVLIRVAGDSVARRVAREMRYPTYHFALDPRVEPYSLRPADLILVANAALRVARPTIGVALYDGIGELDLSTIYDAHVHTMAARGISVAEHEGAVVTAHGLTLLPALALSAGDASTSDRVRAFDRLVVQGTDAPSRAASFVAAAAAARPGLAPEFIHAGEPARFGLEPVLEDLARTADLPTARFAQRRMEYRGDGVALEGRRLPWELLLALAAVGFAGPLLIVAVRRVLRRTRGSAVSAAGAAVQAGVVASAHFANDALVSMLPALLPLFALRHDLSAAEIAAIAGIFTISTSLPQPWLGALADRLGAYRIGALGLLLTAALAASMDAMPTGAALLALLLVGGLGSAAVHPAGIGLARASSSTNPALAVAIFVAAGMIGGAAGPVFAVRMSAAADLSALAWAAAGTVLVATVFFRFVPRVRDRRPIAGSPRVSAVPWSNLTLLRLSVLSIFTSLAYVTFLNAAPVWLVAERGLAVDSPVLGWTLAFFSAAAGAGGVASGAVARRFSRSFLVVGSLVLAPIALLLVLVLPPGSVGYYVAVAAGGAALYVHLPVVITAAQESAPGSESAVAGVLTGMTAAAAGLIYMALGPIQSAFGISVTMGLAFGALLPAARLAASALSPSNALSPASELRAVVGTVAMPAPCPCPR